MAVIVPDEFSQLNVPTKRALDSFVTGWSGAYYVEIPKGLKQELIAIHNARHLAEGQDAYEFMNTCKMYVRSAKHELRRQEERRVHNLRKE